MYGRWRLMRSSPASWAKTLAARDAAHISTGKRQPRPGCARARRSPCPTERENTRSRQAARGAARRSYLAAHDPAWQWVVDEIDGWEAGDDRTFGSVTGTRIAAADAPTMMRTTIQGSYVPGFVHRNNTFTFHQGSEVCVLDDPDGEALVMPSFTRHWDHA